MKMKIYKEFVGAVLFLGVSTVLWWLIPSQIELSKNAEAINSQTFPKMIVGLMWIASLILLVREIWRMVRQKSVKVMLLDLQEESRSLLIIGLLMLYWGLLYVLPFLGASLIFALLFLYLSHCRKWLYYLIVVLTILSISLVFESVLRVSLP